nr:uncharacterized protein LOC111105268 isoform X2 [Crassostrea virginica]
MAQPCPPSADSVSVIESCPMNSVEWNQRALLKNCSMYPQTCFKQLEYHCILGPYGNESLEVCAPNTWLAEDFCPSYNIKQQRILEQFDCTSLISDCPRSQYYSRSILNYTGCLKEIHGSTPGQDFSPEAPTNGIPPWLSATIILGIILIILSILSIIYIRKKRGGKPVEPDQVRQYLSKGELTFYHARGIIIGCGGAGKTTLLKRLMDAPFAELAEIKSTNVVDVHVNAFSVMDETIQAINTDQHLQILQFSRDDIIRKHLNPQTVQIDMEENENTYEDEKSNTEDVLLLNSFQTFKSPNDPQNSDDGIGSECSSSLPITTVDTSITDDKDTEEDCKYNEDNAKDDKLIDDEIEDNDKDDRGCEDHEENQKHEDHKDTFQVETNIEITSIMDAVHKLSKEGNERKTITFLDFAGQDIYYAIHQIYFSPESFSILVVDMRKDPKHLCENDDMYCNRFNSWTYKEFYRFWLQSIDSFCGTKTPVIVVGTHAEGKSKQECDNFFKGFIGLFDYKDDFHLRRHLRSSRCFAIRLPVKGEKLEELSDLKRHIFDLVTEQPYWKRTVKPASAILEHLLQENRKRRIISRKDVLKLNDNLDPGYRLDDSEITTLLKHLHQAGTLLYFEEPALKDKIILDVQWLVKAFKSILAYYVGIEKGHDIKRQHFYETGELYDEELDAIWKREEDQGKDYITHKNVLTSFMEKLGLLAICDSEDLLWYYFPSMNSRKFDNTKFKNCKKSSILLFQFDKKKQFPLFVFYKFVFRCMKLPHWKIHTKQQIRCIYDEVTCFSFRGYIVLVCVFKFQIQVQVCHPANDIESKILKEIKKMLERTMEEFLTQNHEFDIGYKCLNGKFHDEGLNFFPEMDLMDDKKLCGFCWDGHKLGNEICWVPPEQQRRDSVLLRKERNVDSVKNGGLNPLCLAIEEGQESNVQLLLDDGVDVNSCDEKTGNSPLILACTNGHDRIVQHLVNKGADVNLCTKTGASPLYVACQDGHDSTAQLLMDKGADVNLCTETGDSPLYVACQDGHDSTAQLLMDKGADVNLCTKTGASPLYVAFQNGHFNIARILLNKGADVNLCTKTGASPLYEACQNGNEIIVLYLLHRGADVNLCTETGASPLYVACQNGHDSTAQLLLDKGADLNLCTKTGASPLYVACQNRHDSTAQLLLDKGADLNLCTKTGASPLYVACQNRHDSTAQLLLDKGADLNLCTKTGASPLYVACQNGHFNTARLLLDKGADLNLCTETGASPLYVACKNGHDNTAQLLLDKGADVNLCTKTGASPLYVACKNGHDNTAQLLLDKGADLNLCTETGASPLYEACQNGHFNTARLLLDKGADLNLCTETRASPLYVACQNGHEGIVEILLQNGADMDIHTNEGASPLDIACQKGQFRVLELLLQNGADVNLSKEI